MHKIMNTQLKNLGIFHSKNQNGENASVPLSLSYIFVSDKLVWLISKNGDPMKFSYSLHSLH